MKNKIRFVPPDYFWVFVALQILANYLFPITKIISYPYTYLGIILIVFGASIHWIWFPYVFMKKEKTTTKVHKLPSKLVTYGLFKYTRNPAYLGMALTFFGISVLLGSLTSFVFPILFIILTDIFTIPIEEKNLEKAFGKKYLDYKKKVRRWI